MCETWLFRRWGGSCGQIRDVWIPLFSPSVISGMVCFTSCDYKHNCTSFTFPVSCWSLQMSNRSQASLPAPGLQETQRLAQSKGNTFFVQFSRIVPDSRGPAIFISFPGMLRAQVSKAHSIKDEGSPIKCQGFECFIPSPKGGCTTHSQSIPQLLKADDQGESCAIGDCQRATISK